MTETKEIKNLVLTRVPPGDRWTSAIEKSDTFDSLTEGLEYVFQKTGMTEFHLSSFAGKIYVVEKVEKELPPPPAPKKYSLYGEDV